MNNLPNLSNYEEWLINHLEGLLDEAETALLMDFLLLHPNIKAEFDLLSQTDLTLEISDASLDFSYLKKETIDTIKPAKENHLIAMFPMHWIALAATLLLFGYGSWVLLNKQQEVKPILAATKSEIDPTRISEPKTYPQVKTIEDVKVLQKSNTQTKKNLLVSTEELTQHSINPLRLKVTSVKLAMPELELVSLSTVSNAIISEPIIEPKFLKPSEWLVQQVKKNIPIQALAAADTISKGGAGHLALAILNKTTGISMESYAKEDDPRRRIAFVSKFFSYERVTYQKN